MNFLEKELAGYDHLSYELIEGNRFCLRDNDLSKSVQFELKDVTILHMAHFHEKLAEKNDFKYVSGHGFYLDSYAEFGIIGFMDEHPDSPFVFGKRYKVGNIEFEVSRKSDLFHFFTWFEDKSRIESNTLKLYGVTKESYASDVERVLFYLGVRFKEEVMAEYGEFFYPRILDVRESDEPCDSFEHSPVTTELDWSCPATGNLALFNQGETTSNYNFYAYYRFIETFFGAGDDREELGALLKTIELEKILEFAKETRLVNEDATPDTLADALFAIRNRYVKPERGKEALGAMSVDELAKWKVITKEMAIQVLNRHCRLPEWSQ